jgi:hypothetical protein
MKGTQNMSKKNYQVLAPINFGKGPVRTGTVELEPRDAASLVAGGFLREATAPAETAKQREAREKKEAQEREAADAADKRQALAKELTEKGEAMGSMVQKDPVHLATGKTMPLADVVSAAHASSGLSLADWNALEDASRENFIATTIDLLRKAEKKSK